MSETTQMCVPRFRTTSRLVCWVRRNRPTCRVPSASEACFFKSKESPERISNNLVRYSDYVGELSLELESLIENRSLISYARNLRKKGVELKHSLLSRMDANQIVHLSSTVGRMPEWEHKIVDSSLVVSYAENTGPLAEEMEARITSPDDVMRYAKTLAHHGRRLPESFLSMMAGQDRHFLDLAYHLGGRLPSFLEESMTNSEVAYRYAKNVLKCRLPESVERVFEGSPRYAVAYAFDVVRAFSSPKLPDSLHNALTMHSFRHPEDGEIKRYFSEVSRISKEPV